MVANEERHGLPLAGPTAGTDAPAWVGLSGNLHRDGKPLPTPPGLRSASGQLQYHGGPTLPHPALKLVWFGTPAIDRARFERFAGNLMTGGYLDKLRPQGYQGGASFGGSIVSGVSVPAGVVSDATLAWMLRSTAGVVPDGQTLYCALVPAGVTLSLGSEQSCVAGGFWGYHEGSSDGLLFIALGACSNLSSDLTGALCSVLAHEVAESISDPYGSGWYQDGTGQENADLCQGSAHVSYAGECIQTYMTNETGCDAGVFSQPAQPPPPVVAPPPAQPSVHDLVLARLDTLIGIIQNAAPQAPTFFGDGVIFLRWARGDFDTFLKGR